MLGGIKMRIGQEAQTKKAALEPPFFVGVLAPYKTAATAGSKGHCAKFKISVNTDDRRLQRLVKFARAKGGLMSIG